MIKFMLVRYRGCIYKQVRVRLVHWRKGEVSALRWLRDAQSEMFVEYRVYTEQKKDKRKTEERAEKKDGLEIEIGGDDVKDEGEGRL
jgi:hypothetical protein